MRPERLVFAFAVCLFAVALARDMTERWIAATDLPPLTPQTGQEIRDRDGRLLRLYTVGNGRWRLRVDASSVDARYLDMLLAFEDKRFFDHAGVDPLALLRAAGQALRHGRVVSGGSTLSMQVARLLEDSGTGRWAGKVRQMRLALALERRLSKREILKLYLTLAPFGGNLEGVRAASLAWFGKEPARLTPAEAALLVALPQSPEARRPDRHPRIARAARDRVLWRMVDAGVLSTGDAAAARTEPVPDTRHPFPALAPHLSDLARAAAPFTPSQRLTLRKGFQERLETLARARLRSLPEGVSIAIVVADHRTGEIIGDVGSGSYGAGAGRQGFVDMTRALRSPGSTLKPLVYAMAFDRGLARPQTLISDRPARFGDYAPENFDGSYGGEMTVAEALRQSRNIPVVRLLDEIGPANLMAALRRAGVRAVLPGGERAGLAVALGGVGVTLTDLVQLYATIANGGTARALHWRPDAQAGAKAGAQAGAGRRVIGRAAAWQVTDILAGLAPPPGAPRGRLAYKTGTSYGYRDAWALGFDGAHVAGVWIGRADGTPVPGAFGGKLAAPILFEVFGRLKPVADPLPPAPPGLRRQSTAELPPPLRRFRGRRAAFDAPGTGPRLIFPPAGARLPVVGGSLPVKLRAGTPPFTWLLNGAPVATRQYRRSATLGGLARGYSTLSVIDSRGRADRVRVWIDPSP